MSPAVQNPSDSRKVAFIDTVFPTVGVFIAAEIERIRQAGVDVLILPLRRGASPFCQEEYHNLMPFVLSGKSVWSLRTFGSAIWLAFSRPRLILESIVDSLRDLGKDPTYFLKTAAMLPKCVLLAALVRREGISHIHGNWAHYPATAARFISRLLGINYSFSAHAGADIYRHPAGLKGKITEALFVNTCTTANHRYLESLCGHSLQDKVRVIYHGINLKRFEPCSSERTYPPLVLSVGTLTEAKGFHYAIEACRILKDRGLNFQYMIIGRGEKSSTLKQQIHRLGLDDLVILQDEMPHVALRETYARATAFLAPSVITKEGGRDGIPNVLAEAMAMGLAVIASDVSGIPELVKHEKNGLLAPPGDPEALAESIERLMTDSAFRERLGATARRKVLADFDRTRNAAMLCGLFLEKVFNGTTGN